MKNNFSKKKIALLSVLFILISGCSVSTLNSGVTGTGSINTSIRNDPVSYITDLSFSTDKQKAFFDIDSTDSKNNLKQTSIIYDLKNKTYKNLDNQVNSIVLKSWWEDSHTILLNTTDNTYANNELFEIDTNTNKKNSIHKSKYIPDYYSEIKNDNFVFSDNTGLYKFNIKNKINEKLLNLNDKEDFFESYMSQDDKNILINVTTYTSNSTLCNNNKNEVTYNPFTIKTEPASPSCSYLYFYNLEKKVFKPLNYQFFENIDYYSFNFSPDNKYFAVTQPDLGEGAPLIIIDVESGKIVKQQKSKTNISSLYWTSNNLIVFSNSNKEIFSYNIETEELIKTPLTGFIKALYNGKFFIDNDNLTIADSKTFSIKNIDKIKGNNFSVKYNQNLDKVVIDESFRELKKENIYTYNKENNDIESLMELDLSKF